MRKRRRVGVRRFKAEATKILSEVREDEAEYVVTRRGQPIALITPIGSDEVEGESGDEISRSIDRIRRTAKMVSAVAVGASATAVVSRQRR
jgi:prevent-host-death family protein